MKRIIQSSIYTVMLILFCAIEVRAQNTISGTVVDATTSETLPGVNVVVKGTTTGTFTDNDGHYELAGVASLQDTLVFSFVGYQTQQVPIDGRTTIDISMKTQTLLGKEMVVVGYGVQKKETLTGSITSVEGTTISKAPVANVSNTLGGHLPGVTTTTPSGEPGNDASNILIRGNNTLNDNSPLVVIDGIPDRAGGLDRLNSDDIKSISVLKDASAAIYGSRAANGVILVTTKSGKKGKPQLKFNFNQGFNQPTRIPKMADAAIYMTMLNEIDKEQGGSPRYSQKEIQHYRNGDDPWLYPNTDWFAEALKPVSFQTKADMSISGGSDNIQYYLSFGGLTEDGYYRNSATRYNQYNFRSNINAQITNNLSLKLHLNGRKEDRNYPTVSTGQTFRMLMRGKPNEPAFYPNGLPGPDIENGTNPVVTGTSATGYNRDNRDYFQSNLQLEYQIPGIDGLSIRGMGAYDKNYRFQKFWQKPWILYSFDSNAYTNNGGDPEQYLSGAPRGPNGPNLTERDEQNVDILLNLIGEYQHDFDDHSLRILLGTERQTSTNDWFNAYRQSYVTDKIDQLFAGGQEQRANDGSAGVAARLNFFSRFNYDYKNKYLFEFVGRYDGSYIFPKGHRFGFFPSFSLGWRLSEEKFFSNEFFDNLKLRASWGQTGNDRINEWQYLSTYGFGGGYVLGQNEVKTFQQLRTANPNITWEVANQFDVGFDGDILDNQLSFTIDYFNNLRSQILAYRNASVPNSSGLTLPRENIGKVRTWGYDGSVNWSSKGNRDFHYGITLNAGYATNKIIFWDEPPGAPAWQKSTGHKMNTELYYQAIGVFSDQKAVDNYPHWAGARPGDLIFKDVNDDGKIDGNDRVRGDKNNTPEWTGGINISASFKQFDLTLFLKGAAGAVQYIATQSGDYGNYFQSFAEKRWTPDNPNSEGPRPYNREFQYWSPLGNNNTYFLRDTDYIRLKTLEMGYNLPSSINSRIGIKSSRIYVNGFNLLTWDKLKLMDPEASDAGGQFYPQKRIFNIGVSLTF